MNNPQVGSWVQPQWSGHQYYGQSGQIIADATNSNGVEYWLIDVDGDGVRDYTVNKGANKFYDASNTHQGALTSNVSELVTQGTKVFDLIVPCVLAVISLGIFICYIKKLRKR